MAKPKVFKNTRREALARLCEIRDAVSWLRNALTISSMVYESVTKTYRVPPTATTRGTSAEGEIRTYQDSNPRPRRYEEYPENNPANWAALHAEADRLVALASSLREFADEQYHATIQRNAGR